MSPGTIATAAKNVTYGGAGTALWGAYSASDIAAFVGAALAAAGFLVNLYFRRKQDKRDGLFHEARMTMLGKDRE